MHSLATLLLLLCSFTASTLARSAPNSNKAVLLSNIQSLTLHAGKKTSHRRVAAVPQLKCVGGNAKAKYEVDTMRCTNQGSSYSSADVEWSCTASLPPEVKLGSTDVICEGYRDSEDEWVLKGSCGVEYRLVLTEMGEKKFGKRGWGYGTSNNGYGYGDGHANTRTDSVVSTLFWLVFVGVLLWMIYSFFQQRQRGGGFGAAGGGRPGGGGGGGGGGWWPGNDNDPPPPYTPRQPPRKSYSSGQQQGWRPGFWSGAGAGAAAGYAAGRYGSSRNNNNGSSWDRGEGSSRDSSSVSSSRYTSTGFGSTSRR